MSSTNIEQVMPVKLAQALANPLFPALDSTLHSGHHIGLNKLDNHAFLMDFQEYLEEFYTHYNIELIHAPEGFFYLHPHSTTLIPRSILSELDMIVRKILCYLYLSPEQLANEGIFTQQELYNKLLTLANEAKLLKLVNNHSTSSDIDHQKLQEKVHSSLNHLHHLGMVWFMGHNSSKFHITKSVFHFRANVHAGNNPHEAQHHLIHDGKAMPIENHLQLNNETKENQPDSREEE